MKNYLKFIISAIAVALLSVTFASAFNGSTSKEETIQIISETNPSFNYSMSLDKAEAIYNLLPEDIKSQCSKEYSHLSQKCRNSKNFIYQGVKIKASSSSNLVTIEFSYKGYCLKVKNTTWDHLDKLFG
ncbi:MAG: hypothetical protein MJZ16_02140 [Bacteroidales bacterium]|nr:hypothetical protein [Bacteroidales bacterium]